ncbi:MAG: hypothetical protein CMN31_04055 [Sandaracinus sp.]|nr:hypothetical protein [Sandaracinus sp.]
MKGELVVVPCVSFGARARLATDSGRLTPIELVALRGIAAGLDDVQSLSQVVGLGQRPTLDLIYDFWLKGYVVVDTAQARVRLAGEAETANRGDGLAALATAENNLEVVPLVQELVSGAVLPHIGRPHSLGPESTLVPTIRTGVSLEGVTRGEILDAVRREVDRRSRKLGRPLVAQEAWIEPDQLLTEAATGASFVQQRRFLPLVADIEMDPDSGRLVFQVVEAPDVPPPVRKEIERKLSLLSERLPEQLFFKRLRQEFERSASDSVPTEQDSALERLCRTAKGLQDTDPGLVESRHDQLLELYRDAVFEIRAAVNAAANVRPIVGYAAHEAEVRRMITEAERQLVLGNPWIKADALLDPPPDQTECWFDLIKGALTRGVQVFVLWGIQADSRLENQARNALLDLAARHPGRLSVSSRSSTLHAKIVVRDAVESLVTSYNFLSPPTRRDSLELGLVVKGPEPTVAPAAVLDLLDWARHAYPEHVAGQRMLLLPQELGAEEPALPTFPHAPEALDAVAAQREGAAVAPAVRHWAQEWEAVADELDELAKAHVGGADLLVDREHREALWRALRNSVDRLAVLSDQLSVDVVTDRFARLLRSRLEAGARCSFVYRREGATDVEGGPSSRLREQAELFPDLCRLVEARSHAKVLVSDNEVTVGSFNFLSYGGEYTGSTSGPERAELSLRVRSQKAVDDVLEALAGEWPDAFQPLRGRRRVPAEAEAAARAPRSLQPLFRSLARTSVPGDALLEWFESSESPWEDLEALERAGVAKELLATAMASAIAAASEIEGPEGTAWRCRLAAARWSAQDFVGAALLLPTVGPHDGPAPWLTQLGASVEARSSSYSPEIPSAEAMAPHERGAVVLLLLVAVLEQGRFDYLDLLAELEASVDDELRSWIGAARRYYKAVYQPLPMDLLRRNANRKRLQEAEEEARQEFSKALTSAENIGFTFPLGKHTWDRLKRSDGLLGRVRQALEDGDPAALAAYLAGPDGQGLDVEGAMDDASYEVRDEHNERIDERMRPTCLKRLNRMIEKAGAWTRFAGGSTPSPADARVLTACWDLQAAIGGLKESKTLTKSGVAEPVQKFAVLRLQPLFDAEKP